MVHKIVYRVPGITIAILTIGMSIWFYTMVFHSYIAHGSYPLHSIITTVVFVGALVGLAVGLLQRGEHDGG